MTDRLIDCCLALVFIAAMAIACASPTGPAPDSPECESFDCWE
jgi:hypothetical protein